MGGGEAQEGSDESESAPDEGAAGKKPSKGSGKSRFKIGIDLKWLLGVAVLIAVAAIVLIPRLFGEDRKQISYTPTFVEQVRKGNVEEISPKGNSIKGEFERAVDGAESFKTEVPAFANTEQLSAQLDKGGVEIEARSESNLMRTLLVTFAPILAILAFGIFLLNGLAGESSGLIGQVVGSRSRRAEESGTGVTFADVAGIDEAEQELSEIVDFLKRPDKYMKLGARIPRGVLLSGPPGTGKTLLAKAVAGEADVPFFSISASEFVEVVVGVGASRVRSLFEEAKEAAPAIIFIDELDAIGRSRASGMSTSGHDESEQTLNQILTEMDGFDTGDGVVVLGATNRPEILDSALLRAGRFDRRVAVQPPDRVGRRMIFGVHTRSVPLGDDVDLDVLAKSTPGMVGADIANAVNEAALLAAKHGQDAVSQANFNEAVEKIVLGAERKVVQSEQDRRRIALHEAGHAIVGMLTPESDPVRKISIIPRGQSLGMTMLLPDADRFNFEEGYLLAQIKTMLGGRVAEELELGTVTTGAESDIRQVTQIARSMVTRWGMSEEVGFVTVEASEDQGPFLPGVFETSDVTQRTVDAEVRRIVEDAHVEVRALLEREQDKLRALAEALLREETLDQADAYAAAGIAYEPPSS